MNKKFNCDCEVVCEGHCTILNKKQMKKKTTKPKKKVPTKVEVYPVSNSILKEISVSLQGINTSLGMLVHMTKQNNNGLTDAIKTAIESGMLDADIQPILNAFLKNKGAI